MARSGRLAQYDSLGGFLCLVYLDFSAVVAAEKSNTSRRRDGFSHPTFRRAMVCIELAEVSAPVLESSRNAVRRIVGDDWCCDLPSGASLDAWPIFNSRSWRGCGDGDLRWADVDFLLAWAGCCGEVIA